MGAGGIAGPAFAGSVQLTANASSTAATPVHVEFKVQGMMVRPAADGPIPGTGHFHLFVDAEDFFEMSQAIQFDDAHKHYGKGQTSADIDLPAGKHKLTLQFANALHQSYGPEYATVTSVTVK